MIRGKTFTFIEVIVAAVMILVAVVGTSSFYFANRRNLHRAQIRRQATWIAINEIEDLKNEDYENLPARDTTENPSSFWEWLAYWFGWDETDHPDDQFVMIVEVSDPVKNEDGEDLYTEVTVRVLLNEDVLTELVTLIAP